MEGAYHIMKFSIKKNKIRVFESNEKKKRNKFDKAIFFTK